MKKILLFITLLGILITAKAQTSIVIPFDLNTVTMDGQINASEWQDADSFIIEMANNDTITVYYKHDMLNVYFAFAGKIETNSVSAMHPEILFDPQNTKGNVWSMGQWWFHVSNNDCDNDGGYGVFNNCTPTPTDWTGVPNYSPGPPYTDSIEIKIPYSKIGFNSVTQNTMGLAIVITNIQNVYQEWPTSADRNKPVTWAQARINKFPVDVNSITQNSTIKCYPNPVKDMLTISEVPDGAKLLLIDVYGRVVFESVVLGNSSQIKTEAYPNGTYYLSVIDKGNANTQKLIINK